MIDLTSSLKKPFEDWKSLLKWIIYWVAAFTIAIIIGSSLMRVLSSGAAGPESLRNVILIYYLITFVLLPLLLTPFLGYLLKLSRDDGLPSIESWKNLTGEGFFSLLIAYLFHLPLVTLAFVPDSSIRSLVGLALVLIILYLLPLAWFERIEGRFRDAFNFEKLFSGALNLQYLKPWAFSLIYLILIGFATSLLNRVTTSQNNVVILLQSIIQASLMVAWSITTFDLLGEAYFKQD